MAIKAPHPTGPPMDLANMRLQGVHHLICYCMNDACRHQAIFDVSSRSPEVILATRLPPLSCSIFVARFSCACRA